MAACWTARPRNLSFEEISPSTAGVGRCWVTMDSHQGRMHQRQRNNFLYVEKSKDQPTGVALYRCARGTNDLEGFHKHMRSLIERCVGAGLGSDLLLELNYRWNLDRSISNRGLDRSSSGFYDQLIIEVMQVR